jgi:integrase/recombinase XerD
VTQLRQKMLEELQRRNYSHRTAKTYVRIVRDFAEYFHQPPENCYDRFSRLSPWYKVS